MQHANHRFHISIAFGDAILPVIECDDGKQRVPLKPIVDQIGLDWRTQQRKVADGRYLHRRLGVKVEGLKPLAQEQICIQIDRVTAFLNTLNPENIRSMGNGEAADWLESKHAEWDDALHAYETHGLAVKADRSNGLKDLHQLARTRALLSDPRERAAFTQLLHLELEAVGLPLYSFDAPQGELPLPHAK